MNSIGKQRLLELADFLDRLPPDCEFDMDDFATNIEGGKPKCGTAACAAGWAATIPSFQHAGYRLTRYLAFGTVTPEFDGETGFEALRQFFDMDDYEVTKAFDNYDPDTEEKQPNDPKAAAKRIRDLVEAA
jgi:hypothetical protein